LDHVRSSLHPLELASSSLLVLLNFLICLMCLFFGSSTLFGLQGNSSNISRLHHFSRSLHPM
jgi:hypothetical protein